EFYNLLATADVMKRLIVILCFLLSGCNQVTSVDADTDETVTQQISESLEQENSEPTEEEIDQTVSDLFATFDDIGCEDETDHEHFTAIDAVSIALEKYGADDDYTYLYEADPVHYGGGIGYYVAIKSKKLEAEGGDGIMMTLFVSDDGEIYEI
ncbi:MAG TPA: hypothetical protein DCY20_05820, partial [Firmicutes bacterium]|nr:hypothetical protein [Bacillota bacterium]